MTERTPGPALPTRILDDDPSGALRHGCYLLLWQPPGAGRLAGTMRVERGGAVTSLSGDLYSHPETVLRGAASVVPNPVPSPVAGIPVFARAAYRHYLRVTAVRGDDETSRGVTITFDRYAFDTETTNWSNEGAFTARLTVRPPPETYPTNALYLEGEVSGPRGEAAGSLSMGWVARHLRRAVLEVDRVSRSEYPLDNGAGQGWAAVYDAVDWDMRVYESDTTLDEPSGVSWSEAEMHRAMLDKRDSSDLDTEWRFHLLCVRRIDVTPRGIMYDAYAGDTNNIPREGAGIATHWTIPDQEPWGRSRGKRFGAATGPYFRTAVHEIGHAMGLYHNTDDAGFMNTTGVVARGRGVFPDNILWAFNAGDARRLRHMPDPWVRPGMIAFGQPYQSAPISPADRTNLAPILTLTLAPLRETVPIGAPVRFTLTLTNTGDTPVTVPHDLSLKSGHLSGRVGGPGGAWRGFRSVLRCVDDEDAAVLKPGASMQGDITLLRGGQGALFPAGGVHTVRCDLDWIIDAMPVRVSATAAVMVTEAVDESHAAAALTTLTTPDLLLTLAIGGDHLTEGVAALKRAMDEPVLAPHYAVVEAKRLGRRFGKRRANPRAALDCIPADAVLAPSEARHVAGMARDVDADVRNDSAMQALRTCAAGHAALETMVRKLDGKK